MTDLTPAESVAQIVQEGLAIWQAWGQSIDQFNDWQGGTVTGGPNGDGSYPLVNRSGTTVLVPCPAKISAYGDNIVTWVNAIKAQLGDIQATSDSAYAAESSELAAAASDLAARLSQAQNFPADFVEASRYWSGGNGQITDPASSANNPVPGAFSGGYWQSPANPESCYSIGPIGYIAGVPGTQIKITARFRALTDVSNGSAQSNQGVGILPLTQTFSLVEFISGAGAGPVTVADSWQEVTFDFTVPAESDPTYGAYYRPTFFINVVGSANPLTTSLDKQGNQQFELAWMTTEVTLPSGGLVETGGGAAPAIQQVRAAGSSTYTTPTGTSYLRVRLKAAGGGGAAGGTGATAGSDGGLSSFAGFQVSGGKGGASSASNYGRGGLGGTTTGSAPAIVSDGAPGENAENGFNYRRGADGGGAKRGAGGGFDPGQPGLAGCGGAGGGVDNTTSPGGGGGEGGEIEFIITSPAAQYPIVIGAGGAGGTTTDSLARPGGKGGDGFIVIEAH